jgi:hypothetical protein
MRLNSIRRQTACDDYQISDFFYFYTFPTFILGGIYKRCAVVVFRKEKQAWNDA